MTSIGGGKYQVSTPHRVVAKSTSKRKAKAQIRLLKAIEHGWKPTGSLAESELSKAELSQHGLRLVHPIPSDLEDKTLDMLAEEISKAAKLESKEFVRSAVAASWNPNLSFAIVDDTNEVVGAYAVGESQLGLGSEKFEQLVGVEGVALAVKENFRGKGIGKILIKLPETLGVDYIWGMHLKELGNLDHWKKRRTVELDSENSDVHVTAQIFSK